MLLLAAGSDGEGRAVPARWQGLPHRGDGGNSAGVSGGGRLLHAETLPQAQKATALTVSTKGGVSLRTEKWRYTEWTKGKAKDVELYDLSKDPAEFTNVANDPEYRVTREKLAKQLARRKAAAGG